MTAAQIRRIHALGGERNTNRFLASMEKYLCSFRNGMEKVYYLSKAGRDRIGCEVVRKKIPNVDHYLLRNQLYIQLGQPRTWDTEMKITVKDVSVICDATFTMKGGIKVFIEADVSQPMIANKAKIEKYKKIMNMTGEEFHILWATQIESRKPKLSELMKGLKGRVYTLNEIK